MGRGALVLLLSTGSRIMKVIWVAVLVTLILVVQTEAKGKGKGKGKKPGKLVEKRSRKLTRSAGGTPVSTSAPSASQAAYSAASPCTSGARARNLKLDVREFPITSTHSQLLDTLATGTLRA